MQRICDPGIVASATGTRLTLEAIGASVPNGRKVGVTAQEPFCDGPVGPVRSPFAIGRITSESQACSVVEPATYCTASSTSTFSCMPLAAAATNEPISASVSVGSIGCPQRPLKASQGGEVTGVGRI